ncbi:TPA: hypothetical protein HA241_02500 [Candidatus Woesearchaeota archaeon]|nr:hypothetical protein [Candidatus Woesearchaeota archaeon]
MMTNLTTASQNRKPRRRAMSISRIELDRNLETYLENNGLTREDIISVNDIRRRDIRLYNDLGALALQKEGVQTQGKGLEILGYKTRRNSPVPRREIKRKPRTMSTTQQDLEERLETYLSGKGLTREDIIPVEKIRDENCRLYNDLGALALQEVGVQTVGRGLRFLGYKTRNHSQSPKITEEEIIEALGTVFPYDVALRAYKGELSRTNLRRMIASHSTEAKRALYACSATGRADYRKGRLREIIDQLHPSLKTQYGKTLYEVLTNPPLSDEDVAATLRKWFYAGEDLSKKALGLQGRKGHKVIYAVNYEPYLDEKKRQLHLFGPDGKPFSRRKVRKSDDPFDMKAARRMGFNFLSAPWLGADNESRVNTAHIQERQLLFLLHILHKYDPNLTRTECGQTMRQYLGGGLEKVYTATRGEDVQLRNGKGEPPEADGRVVLEGGIECLLEVKGHKFIKDHELEKMLKKYRRKLVWHDGKNVNHKVVLLNCQEYKRGNLERQVRRCTDDGWQVITGDRFFDMYLQGVNLLLQREPTFFETLPIPLRYPGVVMQMAEEAYYHPHLLFRRGRRYETRWFADLLREASAVLAGEATPSESQMVECEEVIIDPATHFADMYGSHLKAKLPENCLFMDLETAGFKGEGKPIFLIGMAYVKDDELVTEVAVVRDPSEEKVALARFLKVAKHYTKEKGGKIVTFNGKSFDLPYVQERCAAHLQRFKLDEYDHVDLLHRFREVEKYPRMTLQVYERVKLGIKRQGDIPGSRIPEIFGDMVYGNETRLVPKVIEHNQMDLITMAIMYQNLSKSNRRTE